MKRRISLLPVAAVSIVAALPAQPPPPPPEAAVAETQTTLSGRIAQFNYGPDGRVNGFVIAPNNLVVLPPEQASQIGLVARRGEIATITGIARPSAGNMQVIQPLSLAVAGRTFTGAHAWAPAPGADPGPGRGRGSGRPGRGPGAVPPPPPPDAAPGGPPPPPPPRGR